MAVPARFEIFDHEARLRSGDFAASPYGSLMGGRADKPRKKPVLVLDPDELEQAHMAIAMGGAQIMDEADDPAAAQRPRVPAMLLGLAPVGADEDWVPPVAPPRPASPVAAQDDWDSIEEAAPLSAAWDDEEGPAAGPEAEFEVEAAFEPEPESEEEPAPGAGLPSLGHLMQPPAMQADDDWEASIPSIEEQLRRMRHLTAARAAEPPAMQDVPPAAEPVEAMEPVEEPWIEFQPGPEPEFVPEPAPESAPEPAHEPDLQAVEPQWTPDEPVLDLPLAAAMDEAPDLPEHEPEHEPPYEPPYEPAPAAADRYEDDGPDLSWMMPKERRQLQFGEASQSSLRARLVQQAPEPEPELPPSLWDRLRAWLRGLLG